MDLAAESSVLNRSTFFTGSRLSFLVGCPHRIRISTDNLSVSLRSASRIPTNCVGPCIRGNFFSSRFQESAVFDGRALSRSVAAKYCRNNGFKDSSTGVNFGFPDVLVKRGIVLAAIVCGFLVLGCRRAFAVESVVNADYGVTGQRVLLLKSTWPKLLEVLGVIKEQGLVLAALLGLSAFFSMAETSITTLWPWKVRELAEKESEKGVFKMLRSDVTRFLTTILIGTTVVNIGATALVTETATAIFDKKIA